MSQSRPPMTPFPVASAAPAPFTTTTLSTSLASLPTTSSSLTGFVPLATRAPLTARLPVAPSTPFAATVPLDLEHLPLLPSPVPLTLAPLTVLPLEPSAPLTSLAKSTEVSVTPPEVGLIDENLKKLFKILENETITINAEKVAIDIIKEITRLQQILKSKNYILPPSTDDEGNTICHNVNTNLLDVRHNGYYTALMLSSLNGYVKIVDTLLEVADQKTALDIQCSNNRSDNYKGTALTIVCRNACPEITTFSKLKRYRAIIDNLIKAKASLNMEDIDGKTAIEYAASYDEHMIFHSLKTAGATLPFSETRLRDAINNNCPYIVSLLLIDGDVLTETDVLNLKLAYNKKPNEARTLYLACLSESEGKLEEAKNFCKKLPKKLVDDHIKTCVIAKQLSTSGYLITAQHYYKKAIEKVDMEIKLPQDKDWIEKKIKRLNQEIKLNVPAVYVTNLGAHMSSKTANPKDEKHVNTTPLSSTTSSLLNSLETGDFLAEFSSTSALNIESVDLKNPISYNLSSVEFEYSMLCQSNKKFEANEIKKIIGYIRILSLQKPEALNIGLDSYNNTLLMKAARDGYEELVTELINAKVNLDLCNTEGQTALMIATLRFNSQKSDPMLIINKLLQAGAKIDITNSIGQAALDMAMELGTIDPTIALLGYGAVPKIPCDQLEMYTSNRPSNKTYQVCLAYNVSKSFKLHPSMDSFIASIYEIRGFHKLSLQLNEFIAARGGSFSFFTSSQEVIADLNKALEYYNAQWELLKQIESSLPVLLKLRNNRYLIHANANERLLISKINAANSSSTSTSTSFATPNSLDVKGMSTTSSSSKPSFFPAAGTASASSSSSSSSENTLSSHASKRQKTAENGESSVTSFTSDETMPPIPQPVNYLLVNDNDSHKRKTPDQAVLDAPLGIQMQPK